MKTRPAPMPSQEPAAAVPKATGNAPAWWQHAMLLFGLLLANLALYHGTLGLDFLTVDDADYVLNNPHIDNFSADNLKRVFSAPYAANYAPAHLLSYSLDVAFARGKSAAAMHLSNVLWHGWVVCMVYWLAFTLRPELISAAAAASLFTLHPAHVEVVAWISSRKDLVATGFAVPAMTCYLLSRGKGRGRGWWYAAGLLCFLIASAGKQSVALLPAVMLAWDILVEKRRGWRMIADKIPFGLITLFFGLMTWHAQPSTRVATNAFVLAGTEIENLWLLSGMGDYVMYRGAPDARAWHHTVRLLIMVSAAVIWILPLGLAGTRQPVRAALSYWILIQMLPPMVMNFVVPITDRYLFLPSVGLCLLLADVAGGLGHRWPKVRWIWWGALAVLAAVWGAKTRNYIEEWRDPRSVWHGAHLKTQNPEVFQFLGQIYQLAGDRIDNFIKSGARLTVTNEVKLARAVLENDAQVQRLQAEWLGSIPARTNSIAYRDRLWDLAWAQFETALARRGTLSAPNLFMHRGRLLVSREEYARAIPEFEAALTLAKGSSYDLVRQGTATHALFAIGVAHWNLRHYQEAERWLLQAQELQRQSKQNWIPDLDWQVERIKTLAAGG